MSKPTINLVSLMAHRPLRGFDVFPYCIAQLAALTPDEYDVRVHNLLDEEAPLERASLTGISVITPVAHKAYRLADRLRADGQKVILGGIHVSLLPEEAIQHADSVVIGEVDEMWPRILDDFKNGRLQRFYQCDRPALDHLPLLREGFFGDTRSSKQIVQTTRGCPFGCDFCSVALYNGIRFRHVPVEHVVRQIEELKKPLMNFFTFIDDNIVASPRYAKKLFRAIAPLNIRWGGQASINIAEDDELLQLARESGCKTLAIGFETVKQESLNAVHKKFKTSDYERLTKKIREAGIFVFGTFMFGFDEDETADFDRTLDFIAKNRVAGVSIHALTPFPGTRLYERLREEGRIRTEDWRYYDWRHVVIQPKRMTEEELAQGINASIEKFFSPRNLLRNLLEPLSKGRVIDTLFLGLFYLSASRNRRYVTSALRAECDDSGSP